MHASEILARVSAVASILAALFNTFVAGIFFLSMALFLVGFLWLPVALLALCEVVGGVAVLILGNSRFGFLLPILGLGISMVNFNFIGCMLELVALGLAIGALLMPKPTEPG